MSIRNSFLLIIAALLLFSISSIKAQEGDSTGEGGGGPTGEGSEEGGEGTGEPEVEEGAEGEAAEEAAGPSGITIDGVDYNCGPANLQGAEDYRSWDYIYVCLIFDNMIGGPRKVLFRPRLDKYELLEIRGLYDIFSAAEYAG